MPVDTIVTPAGTPPVVTSITPQTILPNGAVTSTGTAYGVESEAVQGNVLAGSGITVTPTGDTAVTVAADIAFSTFAINNSTLVPEAGGRPNVLQPGVNNANLPSLATPGIIGMAIVVLCDGIPSATVTAAGGQTIQEVGNGPPASPQTVTGSATLLALNATTWLMTP